MADKTYKLTLNLSDGTTIDAGNFVAPQGQAGGSATDVHSEVALDSQGQTTSIQLCASQASKNSIYVGTAGLSASGSGTTFYFKCGTNKTADITEAGVQHVIAVNSGQTWLVWYGDTLYSISGADALYVSSDGTDEQIKLFAYGKEI